MGLLRARAGWALGLGLVAWAWAAGLQGLGSEARRRAAILRAVGGAARVGRAAHERVQGSRPPLGLPRTHVRELNAATEEGDPLLLRLLLRLLRLLLRRLRRRWLRRRWLSRRRGLAR